MEKKRKENWKKKKQTVKLNEYNRASLSPQFSMTEVFTP